MGRKALVVLGALGLVWAHPWAEAAYRVEVGVGLDPSEDGDTRIVRLAVATQWQQRWFADGQWYVVPEWMVSAGSWDSSDAGRTGVSRLSDIGVRIGIRMRRQAPWGNGLRPYLEAATGIHYLTETAVDDRRFSTHGQFGSHVGAGVVFGDREQYELGWRFLHFSNAGIERPNHGINFNLIRFGYRFR